MYYEGTIQIVDRGDAPALEVIDRNARSLAQRAADETQEELKRVLSRVDNIYGSYESFNAMETTLNSSLEYVDGIQELEEILRDHIKKKKYKQQVTIFIVGYQDVCHEKLTLLQQVNEFFMTNAKNFEKENWDDPTPEIDLDDVASKIEDSLNTAEELTGRLSEINKEMVSYLTSHASHKGSHKAKKKMEKSLQQAKDDINSLSERLLAAQAEVDAKEEKISTLLKQAEAKHMEVQRYKTAAEVAKKNMKDTERLQQEFDKRGVLLQEYQNKVESLGLELTQTSLSKAKSEERFSHSGQDNLKKISELQQLVQEKQVALDEAKRDLERLHEMQILSLQEAHQAEMDDLQKTHAAEIQQLMKELKNCKEKLVQDTSTHVHEEVAEYKEKLENIESPARGSESSLSGPAVDTVKETGDPSATGLDDQSVAPEPDDQANAIPEVPDDQSVSSKISATSSKDEAKTTGREPQRSRSQTSTSSKKSGGRESKQSSKTSLKQKSEGGTDPVPSGIKEYADVAVQDEGGNPDAATVSSHYLDMVREETGDFSNSYDLQDEESWASVPKDQMTGRFMQYRKLTRKRLADLEDQLATTVRKTHKKVDTLKAQFQEHKSKWEAERNVLVQQIGQAMRLQSEAENEADVAMSQLEDFIIEQEKLVSITSICNIGILIFDIMVTSLCDVLSSLCSTQLTWVCASHQRLTLGLHTTTTHQDHTPGQHTSATHQCSTTVFHTSAAHQCHTPTSHTSATHNCASHQRHTPGPHTSATHQHYTPATHTSVTHQLLTPAPHTSTTHQGLTPVPHTSTTHQGLTPGPRTRATHQFHTPAPHTSATH
ncbi:neurofilament medium polypeptide-like [Liolophura sinensis]|uniref:neurofilament medium polypeptide-like n=1 Tax=Liolophura sinensis TaxID=3198878 RepID=UPI003158CD1A